MFEITNKSEIRPALINNLAPFSPVALNISGTTVNVAITHDAEFEEVFEVECWGAKKRYYKFDTAAKAAENLFDAFVCTSKAH